MTDGKDTPSAPPSDVAPVASPEAAPPSPPSGDATPSTPVAQNPTDSAVPKSVDAPSKTDVPASKVDAPAEKPVEKSYLGSEPEKQLPEAKKDEKPSQDLKTDVKPAQDVKKSDGEPKKEEAPQSVEPAPLPAYEAFALPEGVTVDDAKLGEFTKELGELQNLTKADQKVMQEFGQKLVNRHIAEVEATVQRLNEHLVNSWEKQKSDWKEAFEKDPEIGGNRKDTTVNAALEFINTHGGTPEQQAEFRQLMDQTGVGNHPAMIRLLAKANLALSEGKPLPATKPTASIQSKVAKRYRNTQ